MSLQEQQSYHEAWFNYLFERHASSLVPAAMRAIIADEKLNADGNGSTQIDAVLIVVRSSKHLPPRHDVQIQDAGEIVFDTTTRTLIAGDWQKRVLEYTYTPTELKAQVTSISPDDQYKAKLSRAGVKDLCLPMFDIGACVQDGQGVKWIIASADNAPMFKVVDLHGEKSAYRFGFDLQPANAGKATRLTLVLEALQNLTSDKAMFVALNAPAWLVGRAALEMSNHALVAKLPFYAFEAYAKAIKTLAFKHDGKPESEFVWSMIRIIAQERESQMYHILTQGFDAELLEAI